MPLKDDSVIDLGGKSLRVIHAAGHTPGSVIFADEEDRLLFTGDAVGSGSYAWMWMPFCMKASDYMQSLEKLEAGLLPYKDFRFLGGHRMQGYVSDEFPKGHEPDLELVSDMKELCRRLISGQTEASEFQKQFGFKTGLYEYGKAAAVYRPYQLK